MPEATNTRRAAPSRAGGAVEQRQDEDDRVIDPVIQEQATEAQDDRHHAAPAHLTREHDGDHADEQPADREILENTAFEHT